MYRYELRASAPVLAPTGGHFRGHTLVTLTSATAGAHIVVVSDGSSPECPPVLSPPSAVCVCACYTLSLSLSLSYIHTCMHAYIQ